MFFELKNEDLHQVLAPIETEEMDIDGTTVEVIDADKVNGVVETMVEEPDNETFTKEVEAQKAKNAGGGKKAEVAKPSVQAVEVQKEEVEQIDEISKELAGKYLTAPQGKGANKYKTGEGESTYPNWSALSKHQKNVKRALQRSGSSSLNKKPSYYKEEEQLDELSKSTLVSYTKKAVGRMDAVSSAKPSHLTPTGNPKKGSEEKVKNINKQLLNRYKGIHKAVDKLAKEEVEQLDEIKSLERYSKKMNVDLDHLKAAHKIDMSKTDRDDAHNQIKKSLGSKYNKDHANYAISAFREEVEIEDLEEASKLNKLINKYLSAMDFFVNFNINENFEEVIKSRFRDEFSYQNFSEGEKMRIDLALLFTWRQIAKLKNSTNTNLLILDEVFDSSLDTNGTEELIKILHMLEDVNLYVISHKGDILQDKFSNVIRFEKIKNFSRIVK